LGVFPVIFLALFCIKDQPCPRGFRKRLAFALGNDADFNVVVRGGGLFRGLLTTLSLASVSLPPVFRKTLDVLRLIFGNLNLNSLGPECQARSWRFWDTYALLAGIHVGAPLLFLIIDIPLLLQPGKTELWYQSITLRVLDAFVGPFIQASVLGVSALGDSNILCADPRVEFSLGCAAPIFIYFVIFLCIRPCCCRTKRLNDDDSPPSFPLTFITYTTRIIAPASSSPPQQSQTFRVLDFDYLARLSAFIKYFVFPISCRSNGSQSGLIVLLVFQIIELLLPFLYAFYVKGFKGVPLDVSLPLPPTSEPIFSFSFIFSPFVATLFYFFLSFVILSVSISCSYSSSWGDGPGIALTVLSAIYLAYLLAAFFVHLYSLKLVRVCDLVSSHECSIEAKKCTLCNGNLVSTRREQIQGDVIDLASPKNVIDNAPTQSSGGSTADHYYYYTLCWCFPVLYSKDKDHYYYYTLCWCFPVRYSKDKDDKPSLEKVKNFWCCCPSFFRTRTRCC